MNLKDGRTVIEFMACSEWAVDYTQGLRTKLDGSLDRINRCLVELVKIISFEKSGTSAIAQQGKVGAIIQLAGWDRHLGEACRRMGIRSIAFECRDAISVQHI